jgi:hypothetical protein
MPRSDYADTETWLETEHPQAGRPQLFMVRREWMGRRVAIRYIKSRGHQRQRTSMGWKWGTLVPAQRDDNVAVRDKDGNVHSVHYRRITDVYDMTRRLCGAPHYRADLGRYLLGNCKHPLGHNGDHADTKGKTWTDADIAAARATQERIDAEHAARREADHQAFLARQAESPFRNGGTR